LRNFEPCISSGKNFLFLSLNEAPNFSNGFVTLLKSLLERLLSPIILILFSVLINKPRIRRPKVPEFLALIVIFFLYL